MPPNCQRSTRNCTSGAAPSPPRPATTAATRSPTLSACSMAAAPRSTCSPPSASLWPPKPRWVDRRHIAAVLAWLERGWVTRIRVDLMHWTGMRPSQMGRLEVDDFPARRADPLRRRPARQGRPARRGPLVPEGVAAARVFLDAEALGLAPPQRQPRPRQRRAARRTARVHHLPDPALVRRGAPPGRNPRGDIQDLYLWTYPAQNDHDLRPAGAGESTARPSNACGGPMGTARRRRG